MKDYSFLSRARLLFLISLALKSRLPYKETKKSSMVEQIGQLVAGIGIFFAGMMLLKFHLMSLFNERFQRAIVSWCSTPLRACVLGSVLGMVTQHSTTTTLLAAHLVRSRSLPTSFAYLISNYSNVGKVLLVFIAIANFQWLTLVMIGLTALLLFFWKTKRFYHCIGAFFGICLAWFGFDEMRSGASVLENLPWLYWDSSWVLIVAFCIGFFFTWISRAFISITLIAISLSISPLLEINAIILVLYGALWGIFLHTSQLSKHLSTQAFRFILYQQCFNALLILLWSCFLIMDIVFEVPIFTGLTNLFSDQYAFQLSCMIVLLTLSVSLLVLLFHEQLLALGKKWPRSRRPGIRDLPLTAQLLQLPDSALTVLEQEQVIVLYMIQGYLTPWKDLDAAHLHAVEKNVLAQLSKHQQFFKQLSEAELSSEQSARLISLTNKHHLLQSIQQTLADMAHSGLEVYPQYSFRYLLDNTWEALDFIIQSTSAYLRKSKDKDILLLQSDKKELMLSLRERYFVQQTTLNESQKACILHILSSFDRVCWLLRKLTLFPKYVCKN
jgi:phosphate:Na+ symporter